jgi:hypothetical protein
VEQRLDGYDGDGPDGGHYGFTVTDANGCTATGSAEVVEPDALEGTASATPVSCNGGADGTATAVVTGGTGAYSYAWSNGGDEATATGLSAGGYAVTVTDENGCTLVLAATVSEPALLLATATCRRGLLRRRRQHHGDAHGRHGAL